MSDLKYMKLALENAKAMLGQTGANPVVGCVLVKESRVIGIGSHLKEGEPHAEIHALRMAGELANGSTAYVTLEPCSHTGKTGPCADALVKAGVKKVIVASLDPNPKVAGNGIKRLREAGVSVESGLLEEEATHLNEVFNFAIVQKKPFVTLKAAVSLDGKIATKTTHSKWITSPTAREDVHRLRSEHQGIIVGIETILKDNPSLTARIPNGRNPVRIIVDSQMRIPLDCNVVNDGEAPIYLFTSAAPAHRAKEAALKEKGVHIFYTTNQEKVDVDEMLATLFSKGITSTLLEAGGTLNAAFLEQQHVQKCILYIAPKLIGGRDARSFFEGIGIETMDQAIPLKWAESSVIGPDLKIVAYPQYENKKT
ncbi:bifunctional diaminohydroxyphosphoribosylaminopyrimidine deaminase/5-amino-6-(5-phosphoribosylamino)uracil reductase RibD [Shouchella miscanthi]|uniref:Riboflavin biosynthesis protein RibD n=1 Tax=Shouchella miscanthi TaxID=2598861 RepID=A0ABU6NHP9_9BACI|nr:bifunctional diaminohydroxyphosphoribosylaminopyrimidine deaminase/5-amino-6-(5-phosphoribosylamino)uracil reductase RibD [Shouchella miscanthi]MED4127746.1 bifunctional diaminohydroxyphosphoribosylaminopyrimidine deaminase/5-amino-6-(5-phosphoribosylamino)uracil reductase RibD [Shouchella miscanthi]